MSGYVSESGGDLEKRDHEEGRDHGGHLDESLDSINILQPVHKDHASLATNDILHYICRYRSSTKKLTYETYSR